MPAKKGRQLLPENEQEPDFVVVAVNDEGPAHKSFLRVNVSTTAVHISGEPTRWALTKILERAPNLRVLQITPGKSKKLSPGAKELMDKHGVRILCGHFMALAYSRRESLLNPTSEARRLFDELVESGSKAAMITARYLCLNGEPRITERALAMEWHLGWYTISSHINSVLAYVGVSAGGKWDALRGHLQQRVERLRGRRTKAAAKALALKPLEDRLRQNGISGIPEGLHSRVGAPLIIRWKVLPQILAAIEDGRMAKLRLHNPKDHAVVVRHFGFESGKALTLEEIGVQDGVTRERIRQRKARAYRFMGIDE